MVIPIPTTAELWRAEADKLYLLWLIDLQLSPVEHEEKRTAALKERLKRSEDGDLQLQGLLRATGDAACIAHAENYPGADA